MKDFLQRHGQQILGVLSGFDRIRFRGSLQLLQKEAGVAAWLTQIGVKVHDFLELAHSFTKRFCRQTEMLVRSVGREVHYLPGVVDKEDLVQQIRKKEGVAETGLIAVLSAVEPGMSYTLYRSRDNTSSVLRRAFRKGKHYYFYWEDGKFGHMQVRISSWFPFDCHVMLNGREWLAKQLDDKQIGYLRQDNCFLNFADFELAQNLADQQPRIAWVGQLNRLLRRVHPLHTDFFGGDSGIDYYWTSEQTEWATDIVFREAAILQRLYPRLIRHGIETFQSPDVLRFLGHKIPAHGGVHGHYEGKVASDMKRRSEGVRIKHRAGKNSVKMYNKQPTVLRVETTLNDSRGLKVYRTKLDAPDQKPKWRKLRKSVVDLPRRCKLSQSANERYLEALSTIADDTPLSDLTDRLSRPVTKDNRRFRGLRPFHPDDVRLLQAISRGEFLVTGFRNRDIREILYGEQQDANERRRQASRVSRQLALLRAHGLIKKIPRTHRYLLTQNAAKAIAAILAARQASLAKLSAA